MLDMSFSAMEWHEMKSIKFQVKTKLFWLKHVAVHFCQKMPEMAVSTVFGCFGSLVLAIAYF